MDTTAITAQAGSREATITTDPEVTVLLGGSVLDHARWVEVPPELRHLTDGKGRVDVLAREHACTCGTGRCKRVHVEHGLMVTECADRGEFLWQALE